MPKRSISNPSKKAHTGNYSSAVVSDGWLFISGHASLDLETGKVLSGTIEEETSRTLSHIADLLKQAGCDFDDVVKCTCHLARIEDFDGFDQAYGQVFTGVKPARTTVQSVLWGGLKVEIDAIARIPRRKRES